MSGFDESVEKHEAGETWQQGDEETEVKRPPEQVIPVSLAADKWEMLRAEANELGLSPATLARMWLLEKLREVQAASRQRRSGTMAVPAPRQGKPGYRPAPPPRQAGSRPPNYGKGPPRAAAARTGKPKREGWTPDRRPGAPGQPPRRDRPGGGRRDRG